MQKLSIHLPTGERLVTLVRNENQINLMLSTQVQVNFQNKIEKEINSFLDKGVPQIKSRFENQTILEVTSNYDLIDETFMQLIKEFYVKKGLIVILTSN